MDTNTDPVRALIGEMTEYLDQQVDPELDVIAKWRDRLEAALAQQPPSAPAGVDLSNWAQQHYSIGAAALEALRNLLSLAQQPAAVDEAMVDRAGQALYGTDWGSFEGWEADQLRRKVRAVLTAALAQQQGGAE